MAAVTSEMSVLGRQVFYRKLPSDKESLRFGGYYGAAEFRTNLSTAEPKKSLTKSLARLQTLCLVNV